MAFEGNAGRNQRIRQVTPCRHPQALVLQPGALALLGPEAFVGQRLVDQAGDDLTAILDRDRDGEMGQSVEKVGRAVERVDQPARLVGVASDGAGFLEQHAPVRTGVAEFLAQHLLAALVGHRHEIGRALARDLQRVDFVEVTAQPRRGPARGLFHDGNQGGTKCHQSARRTYSCS
jgi:hypothetical protein